jgi:tRNA (mo5U34)-methyltransferase
MASRSPDLDALIENGARLSPWKYELEVRDGVATSDFNARSNPSLGELGVVGFSSPGERFKALLLRLFPDGLEGRSVLDCACNSGAYLFWAKELGAGRCFGFDVRERWIEQARFLAEQRAGPTEDMTFAVQDLYDLPALGLEPFDLVLFFGIFYHLPAPIAGLKVAADLAREAIVLSTTTQGGYEDGMLLVKEESTTLVRSGVYGLSWFPTGPDVLRRSLGWMGLPETRVDRWRRRRGQRVARRERFELVAARTAEVLRDYDREVLRRAENEPVFDVVRAVPEGAVVLVATDGDEALLELGQRRAWHFPQGPNGQWTSRLPRDHAAARSSIDRLKNEGAQYLVIPPDSTLLSRSPGLAEYLEESSTLVSSAGGCQLWAIAPGEPD